MEVPAYQHAADIEQASGFPYKEVADEINNFVYPPIRAVVGRRSISVESWLPFDELMPNGRPYAVYVSIPFCRVRCHSCHCFKGLLPRAKGRNEIMERYVDALIEQATAYAQRQRFRSAPCESIYIGGGTASVLTPDQASRLIAALREAFRLRADAEINFEGNPADFTRPYLENLKANNITRLSIGYQSNQQPILDALNSPHDAKQSLESVTDALSVGIPTVNVDLLYNVPGQTFQQWARDVEDLVSIAPHGIGAGDYVVFPGSASERLIAQKRLAQQHDLQTTFQWYSAVHKTLGEHGYAEQVRGIFARPGHAQRYVELCCPRGCDIVGLGAGAIGFVGRHQFQSPVDAVTYIKLMEDGRPFEAHSVSRRATDEDLMQRFVMHNFFAFKLNRQDFTSRFGCDPLEAFTAIFKRLETYELISIDDSEIRLTEIGKKWRRNIYHEFRVTDEAAAARYG